VSTGGRIDATSCYKFFSHEVFVQLGFKWA